jgi:hypothetical protein
MESDSEDNRQGEDESELIQAEKLRGEQEDQEQEEQRQKQEQEDQAAMETKREQIRKSERIPVRMSMNLSRVKIIHDKSIMAIQQITSDQPYDLARLQKHALMYTSEEQEGSVDDSASVLSKVLYGDTFGPMIEEACLRLIIADHPFASALVVVKEKETELPLIAFAMTHRLHKRQGCMTVVLKVALSILKMKGFDVISVIVNQNNIPAVEFFKSVGFDFVN